MKLSGLIYIVLEKCPEDEKHTPHSSADSYAKAVSLKEELKLKNPDCSYRMLQVPHYK